MKINSDQAQRLLTGSQAFSQFGFSMLLTHLKGLYAKDPSKLDNCTEEINAFLGKNESIMAADYAIITKM